MESGKQSASIEASHKSLLTIGQIAQDISSSHSVHEIVERVYKNVNLLMDASVFGIGMYDEEQQKIVFPGPWEKGEQLPDDSIPISEKKKLAVYCFDNQEQVLINDMQKDIPKYLGPGDYTPIQGAMPESIIYLPLATKSKQLGVITVQSFSKNAYSDYHLDIFSIIAVYAANALDNARLYKEMNSRIERRTHEVVRQKERIQQAFKNTKLLSEIGSAIISTRSIEEVAETVYEKVNSLMDASFFSVGIYNKEENSLDFVGEMEKGEKLPPNTISLEEENRFGVWCFKEKKEVFINDHKKEYINYTKELLPPKEGDFPESIIYLPLISKNKPIGVISVQSFEKNAYTRYNLDILRNLAVSISIALENALVYKNLEETVQERTVEVTRQKEQIEKSSKNLKHIGDLGQEIIASLDLKKIHQQVYESINGLMDAATFGIGLYDKKENHLVFDEVIENNEKLDTFTQPLDDNERLAAYCFNKQEEIIIGDFVEEHTNYISSKDLSPSAGGMCFSVLYFPLISKKKKIGVMTVQSFEKHAYSPTHISMVRNLAVYVAIALENARMYKASEEKVKKRTEKIFKQKTEMEAAFENTKLLSEIGRDITSVRKVSQIIETVYEKVNTLMDAAFFTIGIYNKDSNTIDFVGEMENGKRMQKNSISMEEKNRFAVWCYEHKKAVFINDHKKEYKQYTKELLPPKSGKNAESIIYVPMFNKGEIIGVLSVQSFKKHAYNEYHLNVLKNLAVYISIAIENALVYENLEETVKERTTEVVKQKEEIEISHKNLKMIGKIGQEIIASLSVQAIIEKVYANVNDLMDASTFGIGMYEEENHWLVFDGVMEKGEKLPVFHQSLDQEDRLAVYSFKKQEEVIINDFDKQIHDYIDLPNYTPTAGAMSSSVIYIPLRAKDKRIGVFTVQSFEKNAYSGYHVDILTNLANYIAIALDNARLYENLNKAHKIVDQKNTHITRSIRYAQRIQEAILPKMDEIKAAFPDSFVFFQPRDIVSGDFYWFARKDNKNFLAAVDCTGHGVPGAFMSMIGNALLNETVNEKGIIEPNGILDEVRAGIINALNKKGQIGERKDGMDAALIVFDDQSKEIEFSGANNPLYLIRTSGKPLMNGKTTPLLPKSDLKGALLYEVKPDRQPLGYAYKSDRPFTNNRIKVETGDQIYIFTDGYPDQFGGEWNRKFLYSNFRDLLLSIHNEPMKEQATVLGETFKEWKGHNKQIDDVCVIGVKV